jgi:uncharacterized membrane protein YfcA
VAAFWLKALAVGLGSGTLSGAFGIGGGVITTPAIRLLLGGSAMSAIATPLPVIIPTAITGATSYFRRGLADVRAGVLLGASGAPAAVGGALLAGVIGGSPLLIATAVLLAYLAVDMTLQARKAGRNGGPAATEASVRVAEDGPLGAEAGTPQRTSAGGGEAEGFRTPAEDRERRGPGLSTQLSVKLALLGVVTGLYSGLLGLGGGFVLVPALMRFFGYSAKRAIGTSLIAIALLSIPGTITHYLLGHIDVPLALALSVSVIPGSLLGARITAAASERHVGFGFAALLVVAGALLIVNEAGVLAR